MAIGVDLRVAADFLLVLISREHAQAHRFHASPLAAEFERKLGELATVLGPSAPK